MIRLNKEIKIDSCKNICLKYGSVNKNNPQVIYISGKMWICPNYDGDFDDSIKILHSKFKKELSKILRSSSVFESKYILDFDINSDNLIVNKKKFFSITFFIKQKKEKLLKLNSLKNIISSEFSYLFNDLEKDLIENEFEVSKVK